MGHSVLLQLVQFPLDGQMVNRPQYFHRKITVIHSFRRMAQFTERRPPYVSRSAEAPHQAKSLFRTGLRRGPFQDGIPEHAAHNGRGKDPDLGLHLVFLMHEGKLGDEQRHGETDGRQ